MKTYITLILLKLRLFVLKMVQNWNNFWGNHSGDDMHIWESGKLVVTGEGEVKIDLKCNPLDIKVEFEDHPVVTPCNPHHHDHLHWHVQNLHHHHEHDGRHDHCNHEDKYILIIKWRVHNLRTIKWMIRY